MCDLFFNISYSPYNFQKSFKEWKDIREQFSNKWINELVYIRNHKQLLPGSVSNTTTPFCTDYDGFFFRFGVAKNSTPRWKKIFDIIISQWNCWTQPIKKTNQNKYCEKLLWKNEEMSRSNQLALYVFSDGELTPIPTNVTKSN